MSKDEDLNMLYSSAKHLRNGGFIATTVLLTSCVWFFYRDIPAMGYTFGVCSLMFLAIAAIGDTIMRTVRRHMSKKQ